MPHHPHAPDLLVLCPNTANMALELLEGCKPSLHVDAGVYSKDFAPCQTDSLLDRNCGERVVTDPYSTLPGETLLPI